MSRDFTVHHSLAVHRASLNGMVQVELAVRFLVPHSTIPAPIPGSVNGASLRNANSLAILIACRH